MFEQDLSKFAALIVNIGEIYGKSITSVVINIYWHILKPFKFEDVRRAIYLHLENPEVGRYFPKPADIIMAIEGEPQNQALQAWTKVILAVQRVGSYSSLAFDDALIHAVIEDMGGWKRICLSDDKQLPFISKEFQDRYRNYVVRKPVRYPKYLIGIIDNRNSLTDYKYNQPVLIGDEEKVKQVIATGDCESTLSNKLRLKKVPPRLSSTINLF